MGWGRQERQRRWWKTDCVKEQLIVKELCVKELCVKELCVCERVVRWFLNVYYWVCIQGSSGGEDHPAGCAWDVVQWWSNFIFRGCLGR